MLYPIVSSSISVEERSQVAMARQRGIRLAQRQGFDEEAQGKLALIVSEAATNLLVHAKRGEILITAVKSQGRNWISVLAADQGPGIVKLGQALAGGYSTGKGLGEGLGAIQRLADQFEIFAPPGSGTIIAAALFETSLVVSEKSWPQIGSVSRAKPGESDCGDVWAYLPLSQGSGLLLVVDGLGHGRPAREAAQRAVETLMGFRRPDPAGLMDLLHRRLSGTRGAVALAVLLNPAASELRACGVGNISATLRIGDQSQGLVSLNGTLGSGEVRLQEFSYRWPEGALLVAHTDGISSFWNLGDYPGLRLRHPSVIAGVLYRDHADDRDDATVVVVRRPRPDWSATPGSLQ